MLTKQRVNSTTPQTSVGQQPDYVTEWGKDELLHYVARQHNIAVFVVRQFRRLRQKGIQAVLADALRDCILRELDPPLTLNRVGDLEHHGRAIGPHGLNIKAHQFPRFPHDGVWVIRTDESTVAKCAAFLASPRQLRVPDAVLSSVDQFEQWLEDSSI